MNQKFKLILFFLIILITEIQSRKQRKNRYHRDDSVIILTDLNFNRTITRLKNLLVLFYTSWCGHCKNFLPIYTKASLYLYKLKPRINLAKIEMSSNKETASTYNINSYPTLKFFKNGIPYEYTGNLDENGIIRWMQKNTLPPISELMTLNDISNFKNTHEVSIIYFGKDENILKMLNDIAIEDGENFFGSCDFILGFETYSVKENTIVLFRKNGEERTELSGKLTKEGIINFIKKNSYDKLLSFNDKTARLIWKLKEPGLFLFRDPNSSNSIELDRLFKDLSEKLFGRIRVILTGIFDFKEQQLNSLTNVKVTDLPTVRIYDTKKGMNAYYVMNGIINEDNVMKFVDDFEKGKLELGRKSEEIIKNEEGKVYNIVGKSFENDVINNDMNVLVLFYNEYIEDGKKSVFIYDEIFNEYKNILKKYNLRIGKIDMSKNEVSLKKSLIKYPTVRFYLKGNKEIGDEYEGEFKKNGVIKFINSHLGIDSEAEKKKNVELKLEEDMKSDL